MHKPGAEVDRMVPSMMEDLLFDDILFGDVARGEHARFHQLLEHLGVEILEAQSLVAEALAEPGARDWLFGAVVEDLSPALRDRVTAADHGELAALLVHGVRNDPANPGIEAGELFEMVPLPNFCFQRDPQIILGDGVIFSSMANATRWREALLARLVFKFHASLRDVPVLLDPLHKEGGLPVYLGTTRPTFEGGDLLVLSPDVIAVGHSERTNRTGIRKLARALARREAGPRWMLVVAVPQRRAYMHLDTIFTPIDTGACLVHEPVILGESEDPAAVYEIDLHAPDLRPRHTTALLKALERRGISMEPVCCGGDDPLLQQREQWTDGSNALALAPGVITLYDRNVATAEALARFGYDVVEASAILDKTARVDLDAGKKVCVLLPSHEISRARGGPHCLTHAMWRDPV